MEIYGSDIRRGVLHEVGVLERVEASYIERVFTVFTCMPTTVLE
jgi:hypothetical protein